MYELQQPQRGSSGCKEPDWEKIYAVKKEEYDVIETLKTSLIKFITMTPHAFHSHGTNNPIAELLGTLEIDLIQRVSEMVGIAKSLEK